MGPRRIEAEQGITKKVIFSQFFHDSKVKDCEADTSGQRTGVRPKTGAHIMEVAENVQESMKSRLTLRRPLTMEVIQHHRMNLRECLIRAYPLGLPSHEPLSKFLDENLRFDWVGCQRKLLDEKAGNLWFVCQKLMRTEKLSTYVGTDENTAVIITVRSDRLHTPTVDELSS